MIRIQLRRDVPNDFALFASAEESLTTSARVFARAMHSRMVFPGTLLAILLLHHTRLRCSLPALLTFHGNRVGHERLVQRSLLFHSPLSTHSLFCVLLRVDQEISRKLLDSVKEPLAKRLYSRFRRNLCAMYAVYVRMREKTATSHSNRIESNSRFEAFLSPVLHF